MGAIFLARHGETSWNLQKRIQGQKNPKLVQSGKNQAKTIAMYLREYTHIDLIYSSTLARSLETAKIISRYFKVPVIKSKNLSEMNFGKLEGKLESEVALELKKYLKNKTKYQFPKGENYDLVLKRVKKVVREILTESGKFNVLIVSHQAVNRAVLGALLNLPKEVFVNINHPHNFIYEIKERKESLIHDMKNKKIKKLNL